jgi:predicted small lipoprotein YifL
MKKVFASALICTMLFSLAACNSSKPAQTVPESSETTTEVTETTEFTETTETTTAETTETTAEETTATETSETAAAVLSKKDYLKDKVLKFKVKDTYNKKKKKWTYETYEYHFPVLLIKSSYADAINKAMEKKISAYKKEFKNNGDTDGVTEYIAYLTKDGVLSIVFIETSPNDHIDCRVYNIDVKTGEKVDNARIAQTAGVSNIRKTAMNALQAKYNKEKHYKIKNYKVVKKNGKKKNSIDKDVEKSFNEKHLSANMKIGLTNEGKIFFISDYIDANGDERTGIYDANGKDLYTEKNSNWVRQK